MRHLAILYTNNNLTDLVWDKVIGCFKETVNQKDISPETIGVVVSIKPLGETLKMENGILKNIVVPNEMINQGHLSIIYKISLAMEMNPAEFVSLLEHDVLYPPEYLSTIQTIIKEVSPIWDYLAYNNILGVNQTGYQRRTIHDHPLSSLTFSYKALKDLLEQKRIEYFNNNNWCFLEPGYGGSYGSNFRKLEVAMGSAKPMIHINMNHTKVNHHFTNHYLTYEQESRTGFNEWPGDISYIFKNS